MEASGLIAIVAGPAFSAGAIRKGMQPRHRRPGGDGDRRPVQRTALRWRHGRVREAPPVRGRRVSPGERPGVPLRRHPREAHRQERGCSHHRAPVRAAGGNRQPLPGAHLPVRFRARHPTGIGMSTFYDVVVSAQHAVAAARRTVGKTRRCLSVERERPVVRRLTRMSSDRRVAARLPALPRRR